MTPVRSITRLITCLALLAGAGPSAAAQQTLPVDTMWATVHGHRIAFFAAGASGAPDVILEPGGASHAVWGEFQSIWIDEHRK